MGIGLRMRCIEQATSLMSRTISLQLSRIGAPPFQGSVGIVNNAIPSALKRLGWDIGAVAQPVAVGMEEAMLPFGRAAALSWHRGQGVAEVALYDDAGTAAAVPSRQWAKRNVVLYHGLVHGTGAWISNPEIDLHCANSPYLARVLQALFGFPDWLNRRCLNSRGLARVTDIRLPLPCVAAPDGSPDLGGMELPAIVQRQLDGNLICGHALQPRKQDWTATLSILYCLNELARKHGSPAIKLLIPDTSLDPSRRAAYDAFLGQSGYSCADFFIPVPVLNQRALFRVMRACRFGLAYNIFPEPFGFYLLESVYNGCPAYTNGVGNNRFLLPPEHGIEVHEYPAMAGSADGAPEVSVFMDVARNIYANLTNPSRSRHRCRRGKEIIEQSWSNASFEASLAAALDRLESTHQEPSFDELVVGYSPLVRSLDRRSGQSLNDYGNAVLSAAQISQVGDLLGRRCGDLDGAKMARLEMQHGLFRRGILALSLAA